MGMRDKILLRKRSVIETINDQLKNIAQTEHLRHRSFDNFLTDLVVSFIAHSFQEKKSKLNLKQKAPLNRLCFTKRVGRAQG